MSNENQNNEKLAVAEKAITFVNDGDIVGLGTGSTATLAIQQLAKLIANGLKIQAVPSSEATKALAISLGIPLLALGEASSIDISIDGADEFTANLELIKGGGGALFREKVMASLSKKSVIITDSSKRVEKLGAFKVPIEFNPNAEAYVFKALQKLSSHPVKRIKNDKVFVTDNGNCIFDTDFGLIDNPTVLASELDQIVGVLAHGIFVNLTSVILMAHGDEIISFTKK